MTKKIHNVISTYRDDRKTQGTPHYLDQGIPRRLRRNASYNDSGRLNCLLEIWRTLRCAHQYF